MIGILIAVLLLCIAAWGMYKICTMFQLPPPAFWICGAILLIIIICWLSGQLGHDPMAWRF